MALQNIVGQLVDVIFGYDFFVSYTWADGSQYAHSLYEKLKAQGFTVFLDEQEYARGDNWTLLGRRALRKTRQLVLVATPRVHESKPVLKELTEFQSTGRRIIPIEIGDSLDPQKYPESPLLPLLPAELLKINQPLQEGEIPNEVQSDVIGELRKGFKHVRQAQKRIRILVGVCLVLLILLFVALWQGYLARAQRTEALKTASRTDFAIAALKLEKADWPTTLAYLADALRKDPQNEKAMVLAVSLIRSRPLPIAVMRHTSTVNSINFSPNGKWILTLSNGEARIWDTKTGQPVGQTMVHDDKVKSTSISPDGKWILTLSNAVARIWDAQTGQPVGQPMPHDDKIKSTSISPDSKLVMTPLDDTVRVWDTQTGQPVGLAIKPGGDVTSASFSPDSKSVMTESRDKSKVNTSPPQSDVTTPGPDVEPDDSWEGYTLRLWDANTGLPIGQPMKNNYGEANSANVSPDSQWVVTVLEDTAQVWNARTGQPVGLPMKHEGPVESVSFTPDSRRVLLALLGGAARLWDDQTGLPIGSPMNGQFASLSPDGRWVLTVSYDTAHVWDAQTGQPVGKPMKGNATGNDFSAAFSPNSKWVVMALLNNSTRFWDVQTGDPVGEPLTHGEGVFPMSFSPDSECVVTASHQTAQIRYAQTGLPSGPPIQHIGNVDFASFSPDGRWVMTASDDNTVRIWQTLPSEPVGIPMQYVGNVSSASFSPDGKRVLMEMFEGSAVIGATTEESAGVYDAETGHPVGQIIRLRPNLNIRSEAFSPDGKCVLLVLQNGTAQVWDAQTGKPTGQLMENVDRASFSPDGQSVVTVSRSKTARDHTAQVRDARTGQPVGQPMKGSAASFSSDGKQVVTVLENGVQVWDAVTGKPMGSLLKAGSFVTSTDVSFSPDSKSLLVVYSVPGSARSFGPRVARVWNAQTGQPIGPPMKQNENISSANFSRNGKYVVTASEDKTAQVWDARTGQPIGQPMKHDHRISSVCFTPDSRFVATKAEDDLVRFWDAQTGQAVSLPVQDSHWIGPESFSPDSKWVALVWGTARLWRAIVADKQAPPWLAELAEIAGGKRLNSQGVLEPFPQDPAQLREELQKLTGDDDLSRFGRWIAANPSTRTIDPFSVITTPEFISQRLQENTPASVKEAYGIDRGDPVIEASLAKFEADKDQALFLCRHALKRARMEGGEALVEKVRTIVLAVFPNFTE